MVRNEQEKKPSCHKSRQKLLSCGPGVCWAQSLAIGMAVLVLEAAMVCWVSWGGSCAQPEGNDEARGGWWLAGTHHPCFRWLSAGCRWPGVANGFVCSNFPSGAAPRLHYEVVKVGSDLHWCLLFWASNQNQFILLNRMAYNKVEERQPQGMQSILLQMFPWYSVSFIWPFALFILLFLHFIF